MTERTGLPVHGYQPQTEMNVAIVNANKIAEEGILRMLDGLPALGADPRWVAIARTHIEQGFMAANRAVFRPARIELPKDTHTAQE